MSMKSSGPKGKDGRLLQVKEYPDGLTKQSFARECDINFLLQRAQKAGTLSHLEKHQHHYGDFADYDFFDAQIMLTRGREIFDDLPSEIRHEFGQSPAAFFEYVNDPANVDKLREKLPGLAAPGRQNIDVSGRTPPEDGVAVASAPRERENENLPNPPGPPANAAPAASDEA